MMSQTFRNVRNCDELLLRDVPEPSSDIKSLRYITERYALKLELFECL
jgi:hypothetical protein